LLKAARHCVERQAFSDPVTVRQPKRAELVLKQRPGPWASTCVNRTTNHASRCTNPARAVKHLLEPCRDTSRLPCHRVRRVAQREAQNRLVGSVAVARQPQGYRKGLAIRDQMRIKHAVTIDGIHALAMAAYEKAMDEGKGASAAISAATLIAKLHGLITDRQEQKVTATITATIVDRPPRESRDEWLARRKREIAGAAAEV
jgi:hypothetical protein